MRVPPVALHVVAHTLLHLFSEVFGVSRQNRATHPLPEGCRTSTPSTVRGVAGEAASEKASRYTGVQQLQCRLSRYTLPLGCSKMVLLCHNNASEELFFLEVHLAAF